MRKRVALLAFALLAVGCGGPKEAPKAVYAPPPPAVDAWVLGTRDARAEEPALLWNGLIGVRIKRDGSGAEDGFFAIDEYDVTGEEKIRALPNPLGHLDGKLDPNRPYDQSLDMRSGVLTTRYTRTDGVQVTFEHVMHPTKRMLAERVTYVGGDRKVDVIPPKALPIPTGGLTVEVRQNLRDEPVSGDSGPLAVPPKESVVVERILSFGRSRNHGIMRAAAHYSKATVDDTPGTPPTPTDYNDVYQAALEAWRKRWQTDIEIDGPVEDQQAIRSFLFYLRSAIHPDGDMSVSPFALSSTQYNGHVFWDADIWVFPALALIDPGAAKEIVDYRLALAGRATSNAFEGKPPAETEKFLHQMKFPWESSVTGMETVPGPSQKEIHITGSVLWALHQAAAFGLAPADKVKHATEGASNMYEARKVDGPSGWELHDVMSPDENHIGDNDLYTNLLAGWLKNRSDSRIPPSKVWEKLLYKLPKDDQTFLTYDNDRLRGYKQAAAVLSIYPLQYPPAEKQARAMMERFADKVIKNGPAMTDSVHSVIWSRLGERDKAYAAWKASWEPFTRHPLMLFSEKRVRSKTYFTTGAGGALQSVLYGFAGMRLDWQKEPGSAWSTRLRGDNWLSVKPNLPPSWKSLKFRNFTVDGRRYSLSVSPNAVQVVPGG
jgi:trehalose/maltose hydrolase-like predicted phosphorylase